MYVTLRVKLMVILTANISIQMEKNICLVNKYLKSVKL